MRFLRWTDFATRSLDADLTSRAANLIATDLASRAADDVVQNRNAGAGVAGPAGGVGAGVVRGAVGSVATRACGTAGAGSLTDDRAALRRTAIAADMLAGVDMADGAAGRTAGRLGDFDRMAIEIEPPELLVPEGTLNRVEAGAITALVVAGQMGRTAHLFLDIGTFGEDPGQAGVVGGATFTIAAEIRGILRREG